jgi:hypothetical protein
VPGTGCSAASGDGWAIPGPTTAGEAVKWLLLVRREQATETYDDTIRLLTQLICDTDNEHIKTLPIEDIYQTDKIDNYAIVGCGVVITRDGRRYFRQVLLEEGGRTCIDCR